ncbi:MAG: aminoglycoside N(3)-acetyltransferase [Promethearchaeota archaeon]
MSLQSWEKEKLTVEATETPLTKSLLIEAFQGLGLRTGDIVMVHSAMSALGWVVGGPRAIIEALMEVVTPEGTICMVGHSADNSEPSHWNYPPVPEKWWPIIRQEMLPYDPKTTPTRGVGKIPEIFRTYPGVLRSAHPQQSFTAWGKNAKEVVASHPVTPAFGKESPLNVLYERDAKILLLGSGYGNNTILHYAECMANISATSMEKQGAAMMKDGCSQWVEWEDLSYDDDDFEQLGNEYEEKINYGTDMVGLAEVRIISARDLVDFAVDWLRNHRSPKN